MSLQQGGFASSEDAILPETILFPSLTPVRSLFRIPPGRSADRAAKHCWTQSIACLPEVLSFVSWLRWYVSIPHRFGFCLCASLDNRFCFWFESHQRAEEDKSRQFVVLLDSASPCCLHATAGALPSTWCQALYQTDFGVALSDEDALRHLLALLPLAALTFIHDEILSLCPHVRRGQQPTGTVHRRSDQKTPHTLS